MTFKISQDHILLWDTCMV